MLVQPFINQSPRPMLINYNNHQSFNRSSTIDDFVQLYQFSYDVHGIIIGRRKAHFLDSLSISGCMSIRINSFNCIDGRMMSGIVIGRKCTFFFRCFTRRNSCFSWFDVLEVHHSNIGLKESEVCTIQPKLMYLRSDGFQALQSSGVDLSQANISIRIDLGKRAKQSAVPGLSGTKCQKLENDASHELNMGCVREENGMEEMEQPQKKLKT